MPALDLPALRLRLGHLGLGDLAVFLLPPVDRLAEALPLALALYGVRDVAAEAAGADLGPDGLGKFLGKSHNVSGCHTIDPTERWVG